MRTLAQTLLDVGVGHVLGVAMLAVLVFLVLERGCLDRSRKAIPLRIAVTGTRGKTSVTRMLASVLRENGRRVLAKTTGSTAAFILPDGSERLIRRRGRPSILEQKQLVHLAAELGADVVVAEIMSIHPENHFVEARQLLDPHTVLVTNFRVDHTAAVGGTREDVARVLALDVPRAARVFVPAPECLPTFRAAMAELNAELIEVPLESDENVDLVRAAARSLGIDDEVFARGIGRTRHDIGALGIWRFEPRGSGTGCYVASAFAANDPESTLLVHEKVMTTLPSRAAPCIGLLSLRPDREDRSLQWADALVEGALDRFSRLYVCGRHARALAQRVMRQRDDVPVEILGCARPSDIMRAVLAGSPSPEAVVFGFGNLGGLGERLVEYWRANGESLTVKPPDRRIA